jgi:dimeric dUTPase (all-alpha-NTP-PPase superfamily)
MLTFQLIEMLQLQERLNSRIDPNWIKNNHPWARAAFVESAELLDHVGWKWWKKQETNYAQAHLELVDIWHFILSDALVDSEGRVQPAVLALLEAWEYPPQNVYLSDHEGGKVSILELPLPARIQVFGSLAGLTGSMLPPVFRNICEELGLTSTRLYSLYMQKNVLNLFRQDNGYQEGTYTKVWDGKEDNVVLSEVADEMGEGITRTSLYTALNDRYRDALKI